MSVEKVVALNQGATDATMMRPVNGPGAGHGRAPAPFPPPDAATAESAAHLYDSLALPLPTTAPNVPSSRINASYRTETSRELVETLVGGRLPDSLLRREVETILRRFVETRDMNDWVETKPERLPSHNAPNAHFDLRSRVAATDDDGRLKLFDLYLTRIGPRQWEAAVFERDPSRASQSFPRPTPPVEVHRLLFDPTAAAVLACVAQNVPAPFAPALDRPRGAGRTIAVAVLALALSSLILRIGPWPAAALFILAAGVAILSA